MRLVECCVVVLAATALRVQSASGQIASPEPAGVTRQTSVTARLGTASDSTRTSLRVHVLRGGIIGGLVGLGLSGIALVGIENSGCKVFTTPAAGGGGGYCSTNLPFSKVAGILLASAAAGGVVGSFFGYMYDVNVNERAARCRANPAACR